MLRNLKLGIFDSQYATILCYVMEKGPFWIADLSCGGANAFFLLGTHIVVCFSLTHHFFIVQNPPKKAEPPVANENFMLSKNEAD